MRPNLGDMHGKLVRDRIPEIIRSTGRTPEVRVLDGEELREALLSKLEEETCELVPLLRRSALRNSLTSTR